MEIQESALAEKLQMLKGVAGIVESSHSGQAKGVAAAQKGSFAEVLEGQLKEIEQQGIAAEQAISRSVPGQEINPHHANIALQKATISLQLTMNIKERLERAYQELIRTPLG